MGSQDQRILIAGASGVFGRLLAAELLTTTDAQVVLGARDTERLGEVAESLGHPERLHVRRLDLNDHDQAADAAAECFAVACTAGPFQRFDPALVEEIGARGVHWVDIADDPGWVHGVLGRASNDAAVIPGLSVVPALAGILVREAEAWLGRSGEARVTLFIGNNNQKGLGAVSSALSAGISDPVFVDLPIGRYRAWRFPSPDADVEFRVAFELAASGWAMRAVSPIAQRVSHGARERIARALQTFAKPLQRFGQSTGCVQAEIFDRSGARAYAALVGDGQRLAILPCAIAVAALLDGRIEKRGGIPPVVALPGRAWIDALTAGGLDLSAGGGRV